MDKFLHPGLRELIIDQKGKKNIKLIGNVIYYSYKLQTV